MGNLISKSPPNSTEFVRLCKNLLENQMLERLEYLERKIDDLDAKVWSLESKYEHYFKIKQ